MILMRQVYFLINVLVRAFEAAIAWMVGMMDLLCLTPGRRIVKIFELAVLQQLDRLLVMCRRYLMRVGRILRYRLYFEHATRPMRLRYRQLKRHKF